MRPALFFCSVLLATLAAVAVSCGGSSSETPWPAEPSPTVLGPSPELVPVPASGEDDAGARRRKE
ncbi:Hypothetical protein A7982_08967 [Minicystis rosea]|nr:Hypothetical protein A7982_08967 [Minicystis rosea]